MKRESVAGSAVELVARWTGCGLPGVTEDVSTDEAGECRRE